MLQKQNFTITPHINLPGLTHSALVSTLETHTPTHSWWTATLCSAPASHPLSPAYDIEPTTGPSSSHIVNVTPPAAWFTSAQKPTRQPTSPWPLPGGGHPFAPFDSAPLEVPSTYLSFSKSDVHPYPSTETAHEGQPEPLRCWVQWSRLRPHASWSVSITQPGEPPPAPRTHFFSSLAFRTSYSVSLVPQ